MKISARNCFRGTVENVEDGVITSKVKIKIETPITVTAVITKEAVKDLELKRGEKVIVIIKSTSVMIAKD